jgi:hypothetical protein
MPQENDQWVLTLRRCYLWHRLIDLGRVGDFPVKP